MNAPEVLYVIYDVTRLTVVKAYYSQLYEATEQLKILESVYPNNKYQLIVYRRCMNCDT